eukprot:1690627-Rhodomonas_salina.2
MRGDCISVSTLSIGTIWSKSAPHPRRTQSTSPLGQSPLEATSGGGSHVTGRCETDRGMAALRRGCGSTQGSTVDLRPCVVPAADAEHVMSRMMGRSIIARRVQQDPSLSEAATLESAQHWQYRISRRKPKSDPSSHFD